MSEEKNKINEINFKIYINNIFRVESKCKIYNNLLICANNQITDEGKDPWITRCPWIIH